MSVEEKLSVWPEQPDPECTDCGGTGTTFQTERPCACGAADAQPGSSRPQRLHQDQQRAEGEVVAEHAISIALEWGDAIELLRKAEAFIAGFEGDPLQEGVDELLAGIRAAIAKSDGWS